MDFPARQIRLKKGLPDFIDNNSFSKSDCTYDGWQVTFYSYGILEAFAQDAKTSLRVCVTPTALRSILNEEAPLTWELWIGKAIDIIKTCIDTAQFVEGEEKIILL